MMSRNFNNDKENEGFLYYRKSHEHASVLFKMTALSAGFDLASAETVLVKAGDRISISTGLQILCPPGTYGRICERSGLALKFGICVLGGTIDNDYEGIIKVIVINHGKEDYSISVGDRIAQLIVEKITYPEAKEVRVIKREVKSEREDRGFGSSGLRM